MMVTVQEIHSAYTQLCQATRAFFQATELEINSKWLLDGNILEASYDGRIDGKNEVQRSAQARQLFASLFEQHETHAATARKARYELDIARLEVERVRATLRLAEIDVKTAV